MVQKNDINKILPLTSISLLSSETSLWIVQLATSWTETLEILFRLWKFGKLDVLSWVLPNSKFLPFELLVMECFLFSKECTGIILECLKDRNESQFFWLYEVSTTEFYRKFSRMENGNTMSFSWIFHSAQY